MEMHVCILCSCLLRFMQPPQYEEVNMMILSQKGVLFYLLENIYEHDCKLNGYY